MTSKTSNRLLPKGRAGAMQMVRDHEAEHPCRRAAFEIARPFAPYRAVPFAYQACARAALTRYSRTRFSAATLSASALASSSVSV